MSSILVFPGQGSQTVGMGPPIPPRIRVFFNESSLPMRWPKYWSFSFSIIPSKEIPGLISFRMDWFYTVHGIIQARILK